MRKCAAKGSNGSSTRMSVRDRGERRASLESNSERKADGDSKKEGGKERKVNCSAAQKRRKIGKREGLEVAERGEEKPNILIWSDPG